MNTINYIEEAKRKLGIDEILTLDNLYIMRNPIVYVILIMGAIGLTYKLWRSHA